MWHLPRFWGFLSVALARLGLGLAVLILAFCEGTAAKVALFACVITLLASVCSAHYAAFLVAPVSEEDPSMNRLARQPTGYGP